MEMSISVVIAQQPCPPCSPSPSSGCSFTPLLTWPRLQPCLSQEILAPVSQHVFVLEKLQGQAGSIWCPWPILGDFSECSYASSRVCQGLWKKCSQYYWTCISVKDFKNLVEKSPKPIVGLGDVPNITSFYPDTSPAPQEMLSECLSSSGTSPPAASREKHAASRHERKEKKRSGGTRYNHSSVGFCPIWTPEKILGNEKDWKSK